MENLRNICFVVVALTPLLALGGESPLPAEGSVGFGSSPTYSGQRDIWAEEHPGYAIQTGYEGYLVPAHHTLSIKDIIKTAGFVAALPVLGKLILKFVLKGAIAVVGAVAVVGLGVLLTIGLCTFTPVCELTFHKLDKWHHWDRASVRSLINQDSLNTAADLLTTAITKYKDLGKKPEETTR